VSVTDNEGTVVRQRRGQRRRRTVKSFRNISDDGDDDGVTATCTVDVALSRVSFAFVFDDTVIFKGISSPKNNDNDIIEEQTDNDEILFNTSSDDDDIITKSTSIMRSIRRFSMSSTIDSLIGYIRLLNISSSVNKKKKKEALSLSKIKEKPNDDVTVTSSSSSSSSSLMEQLPQAILLEVMSFLYDDLSSIQDIICSSKVLLMTIDHRDIIINHIRKVILNSDDTSTNTTTTSNTRNNIYCTLCSNPVTYPYQLKDCNHIACGRCIWTATSSNGNGTYTSTTNCKNIKCNNSKIRSCPQRSSVEQPD
jgi:hypothetical protein